MKNITAPAAWHKTTVSGRQAREKITSTNRPPIIATANFDTDRQENKKQHRRNKNAHK